MYKSFNQKELVVLSTSSFLDNVKKVKQTISLLVTGKLSYLRLGFII